MVLNRLGQILIIYLIINSLLIGVSNSTHIQLPRNGILEKESNSSEQYDKPGWTTYALESSSIAKIAVSENGSFIYAWKLDKTPNLLYFNNQELNRALDFEESNYIDVTKGDTLKWVFSIIDKNGGKAWIAFPNEYLFANGSASIAEDANTPSTMSTPRNKAPSLNNLVPDKVSPQEVRSIIKWTAYAVDEDNDDLLYKFFVNGFNETGWIKENEWIWDTTNYQGDCIIETQVRDEKYSGEERFDDNISATFFVKGVLPYNYNLTIKPDKISPQEEGSIIVFKLLSNSNLNNSLYRFFLRGKPVTDWSSTPSWKWITDNDDLGTSLIEVWVKDENKTNQSRYDYSTNLSYDIGILANDGEDLQRAINLSNRTDIIFVDGLNILNNILKIDDSSKKLIGKSKSAKLIPANAKIKDAIWILGDNCSLTNITVEGFTAGVKLCGDNCTIQNTIIRNVETAIHLKESNNTRLINNSYIGKNQIDINLLYIENCSDFLMINNSIANCTHAIKLFNVTNLSIINNTIESSSIGIDIMNCFESNLSNNSIIQSSKSDVYSLKLHNESESIRIENNSFAGKVCDDCGNIWKNNCWINIKYLNNEGINIKSCKSSRITAMDSKPKLCKWN